MNRETAKTRMQIITISRFLVAIFCLMAVLPWAEASANPRYAGLVVDADTGDVLYASHANERRYPASLTKLMTIYLAFEAVQQGKLSMDTQLTASRKAAAMPRTNISLRPNDRITVRDAITALVVHSANDVAVVLAESLGGSEWGFATKMTEKARRLGMNATVFRNASGLPDSGQYTTARDMAVLAMALRTHFPEYYPLFKLKQFSYKGRTYFSHNRVTQRLPGAEGLKTGYINASGFNLVTTVLRNGKKLVGVVMGGRTAATRDSHMISLIERSYARLGTGSSFAANDNGRINAVAVAQQTAFRRLPKPLAKPLAQIAKVKPPAVLPEPAIQQANLQPSQNTAPQEVLNSLQPAAAAQPQNYRQPPHPFSAMHYQAQPSYLSQQQNFEPAAYVTRNDARSWAIQVGAYNKAPEALMAAINASKIAGNELTGAQVMVSDTTEQDGGRLHRARLANMNENQARRACQKLISLQQSCFVVRMEQGESL